MISYVANNTMKIRVGAGGVMLPNHTALVVAENYGTLAQLFPDRIDLGLGRSSGTDNQTAQEIRPDFNYITYSFPREIDKIKKYLSLDNTDSPVRAHVSEGTQVPFYILGSSTDSAHLAAEKGLPYAFASHFASTQMHGAINIYREKFISSKELDKPYTMLGVNIIVGRTNEEALRNFTSYIRLCYNAVTGNNRGFEAPTEMTDDVKQMLNHPRVDQMLKYSFVGSKETVKKQLKDFIDSTHVHELIIVSNMHNNQDRKKSIEWTAEVIDELNSAN